MPVERRGPAVCNGSNNKGGKGEMTKAPIKFARPEEEPLYQGEGGSVLAFLGAIRSHLQNGDLARSLSDGEK